MKNHKTISIIIFIFIICILYKNNRTLICIIISLRAIDGAVDLIYNIILLYYNIKK